MSLRDVERFSLATETNAALWSVSAPGALEAICEIAAHCGYGFTIDEVRSFLVRGTASAGRELSDSQLERVTGGMCGIEDR